MNAAIFRTVSKISADAATAQLTGSGYLQHMIGTDPLVVVGCVDNFHPFFLLFLKISDGIYDGGRELKIKVIQMHCLRRKILQHPRDFPESLCGVNDLKGVDQLLQLTCVEIHGSSIAFRVVSHHPAGMLHTKILHLMSHPGKLPAQLEYISL